MGTFQRPKRTRSESLTVSSDEDEISEAEADNGEVTVRRYINFQDDSPRMAVSNVLPTPKRARAASEPGRGVGAPIRAVRVSGSRVSMPKRTFKRLATARSRVHALEKTVIELRAKLANGGREELPAKMTRVAACAALVALGVSETKVPHVLAASATYFGVQLDPDEGRGRE